MKKFINASTTSRGNEQLQDAIVKLQEVENICGDLEDYYFGEDVATYFMKCYDYASKALKYLDKANAVLN